MKSIQINGEAKMKTFKLMSVVLILGGILISGCGAVQSGKAMSNADSLSMAALAQAVAPVASSTQAPVLIDDKGNEATGTVQAITDTSITIGGQTYTFAPGAEIKGTIAAGALVKLHFITNADGSLSIREVEIVDPTQINTGGIDDNSNNTAVGDNDPSTHDLNDDNSNGTSVGSDNSSTHDINDDQSNDSQGNHQTKDDKGSDNHGSGSPSGDDNSGGGHG